MIKPTFFVIFFSAFAILTAPGAYAAKNEAGPRIHSRCPVEASSGSQIVDNERCRDGRYCPVGTHCVCDSQGCYCVYDRPWL